MPIFANSLCVIFQIRLRIMYCTLLCGWHMFDYFIRSCYYRQMCPLMSDLSTDPFAGWFAEALRNCFFITITGRWVGTIFRVLIKLFPQFLNGLIELSD